MRPLRTYLVILYSLAVLFMLTPMLSVLIASAIASAAGAQLDEARPHPCVILGFDFGGVLYAMFVAGWFGRFTFPFGLMAILTIARHHLKLRNLPTAVLPAKPATLGSTQKLAVITPLPHQRSIRNS